MSFAFRRFYAATILATAIACSSDDKSGTATGETGGTLVIALPSEPATLLPPLIVGAQEKEIVDQLFDALAETGPDMNTVGDAGFTPRLAQSWEWSGDSLSIAFRINPGARWHDGEPVTARDVRFTVDMMKDPKTAARARQAIVDVDSVSVRDSLTAVVWFARRSPEQFYNVVYNVIPVPEHLLRDADRAALASHPFGRAPVGSGPFRFVNWNARTSLEVAADTTHYLGRPLLNRVVWTLHPDPVTALVTVLAGEADLLEILIGDGMSRVAAQTLVGAVPYTNPNYGYLGFNFRDPKNPERPHPLFGDPALRRAIIMAIDRQVLLKNVFDTLAWLGSGPFSRMLSSADTTLRMVSFDSAGADRLLDSLGWRDADGNGVRERNGRPLRFGLMAPSSSVARKRYAELIQAELRPHGIQVDVDLGDNIVVIPRMNKGQYDAMLNSLLVEPSPSSIRDNWRTATVSARASNYQLYGNPMVDAAIDSAIVESDPGRSRTFYRQAYQGIIDDHAGIWLYENKYFMALNKRVHPDIRGRGVWWQHLRHWSIPAAGRLPRDG